MSSVSSAILPVICAKQYGYEDVLARAIAEACLYTLPPAPATPKLDVDNIRTARLLGGSIAQTHMMPGMVLQNLPQNDVLHVQQAKVLVLTCGLEASSSETKGTVLLQSAQELLQFTRSEEAAVVERMAHPAPAVTALAVAKLEDIMNARALVDKIYIDEKIVEYILDLVIATRPGCRAELSSRQSGAKLDELDGLVSFGASPRASIALALAARGAALLAGRAYVLPQDVKEIAPDVLRHRIVLSYEAEAENIDTDAVIQRLLAELRTP